MRDCLDNNCVTGNECTSTVYLRVQWVYQCSMSYKLSVKVQWWLQMTWVLVWMYGHGKYITYSKSAVKRPLLFCVLHIYTEGKNGNECDSVEKINKAIQKWGIH